MTLDGRAPSPPFLQRLSLREDVKLSRDEFPGNLRFIHSLDIRFDNTVTFFVGENGSGKSTVMEAIASLCGLPIAGGGRNELADLKAPHATSELAPFLLGLLSKMARLARSGGVQLVVATHSPIILTFPGATLLSFDGEQVVPIRLEETSHYQITKGILDVPQRYWKHLLADEDVD